MRTTSLIEVQPIDLLPCAWPYVYFHGKIQDIMETDLVSSDIKLEGIPDGIRNVYHCETVLKLFLWTPTSGPRKGLIVLAGDLDAEANAGAHYQEKTRYL